ncbi:MAG: gliding motility-associated C-terminal domain-containing protein, partial [Bacteroidetes bacterium]|nr:gliding motility-associated C-terminal domain-containing protein [Bacteroidota bacterium]
ELIELPDASILGPDSLCEETNNVVYSNNSPTSFNKNWRIYDGTITTNNHDSINVNWPDKGTEHRIYLKITDVYGCENEFTKRVALIERPRVEIAGKDSTCFLRQETLLFTNSYHRPSYSNNWSTIGVNRISAGNSDTLACIISDRAKAFIKLEVVNNKGCSRVDTGSIYPINFQPIDLEGNKNVCSGTTHQYELNSSLPYTYDVSVIGGRLKQYKNDSFSVTWFDENDAGWISVDVISTLTCDSQFVIPVQINKAPIATLSGRDLVCRYSNVEYKTSWSSDLIYDWKAYGGEILKSDSNYVSTKWNADTGYIAFTATNKYTNCKDSNKIGVTIKNAPNPIINGDTIYCNDDNLITYTAVADKQVRYLWRTEGGQLNSDSTKNSTQVLWNNELNKVLFLFMKDTLTGCDTSLEKAINSFKIKSIIPPLGYLCGPDTLTMRVFTNDSANNYWFVNGQADPLIGNRITYKFEEIGKYDVKVKSISKEGCEDEAYATVNVYPIPNADFTAKSVRWPEPAWEKEDTVWFTNHSKNSKFYTWKAFGEIKDSTKNWQSIFDTIGEYEVTLIASSARGCKDSITRLITIEAPTAIYVPNSFTPNNDGINDFFEAPGYHMDSVHLQVFNRWGERVFETTEVDFKWDATFRGEPVPVGVYVWVLNGRDVFKKQITMAGNVTVIR